METFRHPELLLNKILKLALTCIGECVTIKRSKL